MSEFNGTSQDFPRLTQMRETFFRPMSEISPDEMRAIKNLLGSANKIVHNVSREEEISDSFIDSAQMYAIASLFGLIFISIASVSLPVGFGWAALIYTLVGFSLIKSAYEYLANSNSKLGNTFTATPMFALQTSKDGVKYWGMWAFTQMQITEHYVNGIYASTNVSILFPFDTVYVNIRNPQTVEQLGQALYAWRDHALAAVERRDWNYFQPLDYLAPLRVKPLSMNAAKDLETASEKPVRDNKKLLICGFLSILFGLAAGSGSTAVYEKHKNDPPYRSITTSR